MSRPRRVTPRFPSIIHRAAAASAPVFNSPDDHIIPPPKRAGPGRGRGGGQLTGGRKEEKQKKKRLFLGRCVALMSKLRLSPPTTSSYFRSLQVQSGYRSQDRLASISTEEKTRWNEGNDSSGRNGSVPVLEGAGRQAKQRRPAGF